MYTIYMYVIFKPVQINNGIFDTRTNDMDRTIDTIDIPTLKGQAQGPCHRMCLYNFWVITVL
jgi:hypothetical protein